MGQYVPGSDSPENLDLAAKARDAFETAIAQQPGNEQAMTSIALLYFNQGKLDEAKVWYDKLTVLSPENKEAFYTLGVIAWTRGGRARRAVRARLGMKPEDPGPLRDAEVRQSLRADYLPVVREGIDDLETALQLDGEYDDAMSYLNLLYRVKADLENLPEEYRADIAMADEWVRKSLQIRKSKAGRGQ